jgi:hypothetical protein
VAGSPSRAVRHGRFRARVRSPPPGGWAVAPGSRQRGTQPEGLCHESNSTYHLLATSTLTEIPDEAMRSLSFLPAPLTICAVQDRRVLAAPQSSGGESPHEASCWPSTARRSWGPASGAPTAVLSKSIRKALDRIRHLLDVDEIIATQPDHDHVHRSPRIPCAVAHHFLLRLTPLHWAGRSARVTLQDGHNPVVRSDWMRRDDRMPGVSVDYKCAPTRKSHGSAPPGSTIITYRSAPS